MKKIISIIIILINITTYSQHNLSGKILSKKNKEPIAGASIILKNTNQYTISDINGYFEIKNIAIDTVNLSVTSQGYKSFSKTIILKQKFTQITVYLEEEVFNLDEVIVSTPFSKLQKDNVMKVERRSMKKMEKNGIQNLMDGVAQIPGVSKISTGTGISKPVIRGLSGNRVLVFDKDMRVENFQFGEAHGLGIDESGISAIEVIKGPASLLYGSDALGGVIYLVPEHFARQNQSEINGKFQYYSNTQGKYITSAYKKSGKNLKFLIRGSVKQNGDFRIPNGKYAYNSANDNYQLTTGIGFKTGKIKTEIRYGFNQRKNGLPMGTTDDFHFKPVDKYQQLTNNKISIKNIFQFDKSSLTSTFGFSGHKRELIKQANAFIGMNLKTFDWDLKWKLPTSKNFHSVLGMQNMYQNNHNFGQHFLLPNADIVNSGIFGVFNFSFHNIDFQSGIRADLRNIKTEKINDPGEPDYRPVIDKTLYSISGAIGAKKHFDNGITIRANIAKGFRAPNLAELTSNGIHNNRLEFGNPDLKNEENLQTDLNISYENTHIELFINGFYNNINNYIYLSPTNQPMNMLPVYEYKQNDAYLYGGEVGFHFHPHPWDWLHYDSSFETVTGKQKTGEYLPLIPVDQWKNNLRINIKSKNKFLKNAYLIFSVNRYFETKRVNEFEDTYPAYTLINTGIGNTMKWKKNKILFNLSIHNLLNKEYINNLSVLREQNIPGQGRNIILTLKFKI